MIPEKNWPEKALFVKCVRGDAGDNIPSAYPGARETKILECFNNKKDKSFCIMTEYIDGLTLDLYLKRKLTSKEKLSDEEENLKKKKY